VNVVVSHADGGGKAFLDGRLIRVSASTGEMEVLARGRYADLRISTDGRYLAALHQAEQAQPQPDRLSEDWWVTARSVLVLFDLKQGSEPRPSQRRKIFFPAVSPGRRTPIVWLSSPGTSAKA